MKKLNATIAPHQRYSMSSIDWFDWLIEQLVLPTIECFPPSAKAALSYTVKRVDFSVKGLTSKVLGQRDSVIFVSQWNNCTYLCL